MSRAQRQLEALFRRQNGRCFYCGCETHRPDPTVSEKRQAVCERLGISRKRIYRYRRATREHLTRAVDGGADATTNLVMACQWCNSNRQDLSPSAWSSVVAYMIRAGRHPCVAANADALSATPTNPRTLEKTHG